MMDDMEQEFERETQRVLARAKLRTEVHTVTDAVGALVRIQQPLPTIEQRLEAITYLWALKELGWTLTACEEQTPAGSTWWVEGKQKGSQFPAARRQNVPLWFVLQLDNDGGQNE